MLKHCESCRICCVLETSGHIICDSCFAVLHQSIKKAYENGVENAGTHLGQIEAGLHVPRATRHNWMRVALKFCDTLPATE